VNTTIFLFVRDSYREIILSNKLKKTVHLEFISLGDNLTDYKELKSDNIHFVIDLEIYNKNREYFNVIKNYYLGSFILLKNDDKLCPQSMVFDICLDVKGLVDIIPLFEKIDVLEDYVSRQDLNYVEEKVSLTHAYYSHLESLEVVNSYGVDIDLYHSVGKNRFSNIFWIKNRWNKLLFIDINIGFNKPDFLTLLIIKDWELFYEQNKDEDITSDILNNFISMIVNRYIYLKESDIQIVFAIIDSNGVEYFSHNYKNVVKLHVGDESFFICGIDQRLLKGEQIKKIKDVYSLIESRILQIEESSISDVNKYAFIFKLGNFNIKKETTYKFGNVLENTGIIKFFELSKLNYIINISFEKISKLVKEIESEIRVELLKNIKIVLREIIINSIEHGLKNSVCGTVYFHYYFRNNRIVFTVEDSGKGFQYDMRSLDNESRRGKGLHLIDNIVDDIYFNKNGNLVRVEFNLDRWRKNDI